MYPPPAIYGKGEKVFCPSSVVAGEVGFWGVLKHVCKAAAAAMSQGDFERKISPLRETKEREKMEQQTRSQARLT